MNLLSPHSALFMSDDPMYSFMNPETFVKDVYDSIYPEFYSVYETVYNSLDRNYVDSLKLRMYLRKAKDVLRGLIAVFRGDPLEDSIEFQHEYRYTPEIDDALCGPDPIDPVRLETRGWIYRYASRLDDVMDSISAFPTNRLDYRGRSLVNYGVVGTYRPGNSIYVVLRAFDELRYDYHVHLYANSVHNFRLMVSATEVKWIDRVAKAGTQDVDRTPIEVASSLASNTMRRALEFIVPEYWPT